MEKILIDTTAKTLFLGVLGYPEYAKRLAESENPSNKASVTLLAHTVTPTIKRPVSQIRTGIYGRLSIKTSNTLWPLTGIWTAKKQSNLFIHMDNRERRS